MILFFQLFFTSSLASSLHYWDLDIWQTYEKHMTNILFLICFSYVYYMFDICLSYVCPFFETYENDRFICFENIWIYLLLSHMTHMFLPRNIWHICLIKVENFKHMKTIVSYVLQTYELTCYSHIWLICFHQETYDSYV